ncbi:MAG: COX15/CtaA family protein, partial [Gemmatimonadales bacterium]
MRRFKLLAWTAAIATYLLIVLGAVVRITGSGMGCGDDWPLCHGRLIPPLDDVGTVIEWSHRLLATPVAALVAGLAAYTWILRRRPVSLDHGRPGIAGYVALGLLIPQILLGAVTVFLELPAWTVILHFMTAMLVLASLLVAARGVRLTPPGLRPGSVPVLVLAFVTVLLGALTANLGAAAACGGFPLCSGEIIPSAGPLAYVHWTHRVFAYALAIAVVVWAVRRRPAPAAWALVGLVTVQVALG